MKDIKILGVDIAKDVFQLCGIDEWGKVIYTRRVKRAQYVSTVASLKVGCVVMDQHRISIFKKRRRSMKDIKILGVDIAKDVFQLCGIDEWGKVIYTRRVKRAQYVSTVASLKVGCVVMEACGGANHWYRTFMGMGISTQLISPQHVKPYVKSNKNDRNDAQAIAEAASRASMRFVRGKTVEQQDVQALLKIRDRLVKSRTALINEIRGLLQEYGLTMARGAKLIKLIHTGAL